MASAIVLRNDTFIKHVRRVRGEIGAKFARAHQVLVEREAELLSELQQLEERYWGEGITEQIKELNKLKELQLATTKLIENKEFVRQQVSMLNARVRMIREEFKKKRDCMRRVVLNWDGKFEDRLREVGAISISNVPDYKERGNPVMIACKHNNEESKSDGVFYYPRSLTIDSETNNVYVCDGWNHRVQVFSKSLEFLFDFSEKMNTSHGICINNGKVYVTQSWGCCLNVYSVDGNFLETVGTEGKKKLEFEGPRGVAASKDDKERIYICDNGNHRVQCLNTNLTFDSFISYIPDPRDVKLTPERIIVLVGGENCIRYYNYAHQLIREMIPCGVSEQVIEPFHFCLDKYQNILITDWSAHRVIIYSNKGELMHKFGKEGQEKGEFINPRGIVLDSDYRIIVASNNAEHCIQLF